MEVVKVFFFGDSICVGQYVSIHKGWVTRVSAALSDLAETHGCKVIVTNSSGNGRTTRQALEVMPYEVQSKHPHLMIVQFGMNDCNYWESDKGVPRVSPKAFAANLEEIITRAFTFGARKVLLNTNHPTGNDKEKMPFTRISYQQSNEQYNQVIREVASSHDTRVVLNDIEKAFTAYAAGIRERLLDLLLPEPDLLHPSDRGHALYFDIVYPVVRDALLELVGDCDEPGNERS
ncbi:MAG: hypothetical protein GTO24_20070 [candidate division Zixibacteria bacterium]|nr:hypothetical protein [candidate division Zixibacteria bacterium]